MAMDILRRIPDPPAQALTPTRRRSGQSHTRNQMIGTTPQAICPIAVQAGISALAACPAQSVICIACRGGRLAAQQPQAQTVAPAQARNAFFVPFQQCGNVSAQSYGSLLVPGRLPVTSALPHNDRQGGFLSALATTQGAEPDYHAGPRARWPRITVRQSQRLQTR